MRIDMTIHLVAVQDYLRRNVMTEWTEIQMTPEQARSLRDQITKHLRGPGRDKEPTEVLP